MWVTDPLPPACLQPCPSPDRQHHLLELPLRRPTPSHASHALQEAANEAKPEGGGQRGRGQGWLPRSGLFRFGCLTQKRLVCKELIRSQAGGGGRVECDCVSVCVLVCVCAWVSEGGVLLPQTKGQASRQRLMEWGGLVAFLPSGAFVF